MSELKDLKDLVKKELLEQKIKKYKGLDEIHIISEVEPTTVVRSNPRKVSPEDATVISKKTRSRDKDTGRRPVRPSDIESPPESSRDVKSAKYLTRDKELTPEGKAAQQMYSIWNSNIVQLMNFRKGQELSQKIAVRLQKQTGLPAQQMLPVVSAIMKAVLEQLDDEVEAQVEKDMPGVLDPLRA